MANRSFVDKSYTLEKGIVRLHARVSVAGGGAVTLQTWNPTTGAYASAPTTGSGYAKGAYGISSVARTGTGAWTIVLQDSYRRLLGVTMSTTATSGVSTVISPGIDATTDVTSNTAPTIKLVLSSATATAADPASGDKIDLTFELQNSTAR